MFSLTVSPPDTDEDDVAEYDDFCPGATPSATSTDPTNADFDGDGTAGSDADPNDDVGGDVCDIDDDNDGMPDTYELANSLDPFDPADAVLDADGDGVSNLQEYLDGTNPNLGNLVIDATGYLTPYKLTPPEPTSIHTQATAVTASDYGPYRPGDNTITWKPSNGSSVDLAVTDPGNLVSDPPVQPFDIRPLASVAPDQQVEENSAATVTVTVRLNGDSPSWTDTPTPNPATVNYTVSGTASNPADHNAVSGVLTFNDGDYAEDITFNVFTDGISDPDETVVITLTGASNAAIGSRKKHTVTIVEGNVAPRADLRFSQGGVVVGSAWAGDGAITIDALPTDANSAQTLGCDWSGTDNSLLPPGIVADCKASPSWTVAAPVAGNYRIDVVVSDSGSPSKSVRVSRVLHVASGMAAVLSNLDDADMDGIDDLTEGYADTDGDGIPAYLDAIDGTVAGGNLVPDQTLDPAESMMLETESGLTLRRGNTAQAAGLFGALVTDGDIVDYGSASGNAPVNGEDDFDHVGGIYDFSIHGLIHGSSASIVVPLQSSIPKEGRYRIYHPDIGWSDFVVDDFNGIASAAGEPGACPEPGSSAYETGLLYLHNCVQLTIQDGGPNDTDGTVNGIINDPAGVGLKLTDPQAEKVEEGSGRVSPLLLALLLALGVSAYWRRRRGVSID
jgi:hypothetical protein